jgi:hypothetical protein
MFALFEIRLVQKINKCLDYALRANRGYRFTKSLCGSWLPMT